MLRSVRLFMMFLLFSTGICLAQKKVLYNVVSPKGDTNYDYTYQQRLARQLSLARIDTASNILSFRLSDTRRVIDLSKNNGIVKGTITSWTHENTPQNEPPTNRLFFETQRLSADTAEILLKYMQSSGVLSIPTADSIGNWGFGDDGTTYTLEYATPNTYTIKSYWEPKMQDSIDGAIQIQNLIDTFLAFSNAKALMDSTIKHTPFQYFGMGGVGCSSAVTRKQARQCYRERQHYRKQQQKLTAKH